MFNVHHIRTNRYSSSLLYFIIICILVVCTATERPEFKKLSYTDSNNASSITSSGNDFFDIVSDEITSYSVIKSIVSKKPIARKTLGSRGQLTCAAIGDLFILTGICVFFLLYFYRELTTSHLFIITYIHNLDGMKP